MLSLAALFVHGPNCHGAAPRPKRTPRRHTLAQQGRGSHHRVSHHVATRVVTGFHLSPECPSSLGVALALSHAALPKED
ncbi:MAG: hypothetical protein DI601_22720 [Azospirillum brasilense]|nr:MAG: hypothetical protein DI601_22720 [Azospirillum brasilense]